MGLRKESRLSAFMTEELRLRREVAELCAAIEAERAALRENPNDREAQFFLRAKRNLLSDLERRLEEAVSGLR